MSCGIQKSRLYPVFLEYGKAFDSITTHAVTYKNTEFVMNILNCFKVLTAQRIHIKGIPMCLWKHTSENESRREISHHQNCFQKTWLDKENPVWVKYRWGIYYKPKIRRRYCFINRLLQGKLGFYPNKQQNIIHMRARA